MFGSFVVTLREGIEAALIIAMVLAYLHKIGRSDLARSAYAGLLAAVALSLAGAVAARRFQFNQDVFEGWVMLISSFFIATVVVWMWRVGKRLKGQIETRMGELVSAASGRFSIALFAF